MRMYIEQEILFFEGPSGKKQIICTMRKNGLPCDFREGLESGDYSRRKIAEYLNVSEIEVSTALDLLLLLTDEKNRITEVKPAENVKEAADSKTNSFFLRRLLSKLFM